MLTIFITALKSAWHCHCSSAHETVLQLERRDHERESEFNVLFLLRKHEEQSSNAGKAEPTSFLYTLSTTKICSVRLTTAWKRCRT
jgi:hypothetical protein